MRKTWLRYLRGIIPWGAIAIAFFWLAIGLTNPALAASEANDYQCETESCDPINKQPFFGDLHVHTNYSLDSYIFGNTNDPRAAYRFATGEPVPIAGRAGTTEECPPEAINNPRGDNDAPLCHELLEPLDFTAVTDHAETMGEYNLCVEDENSPVYNHEDCQGIRQKDIEIFYEGFAGASKKPPERFEFCNLEDGTDICREASKGTWQEIQEITESFNNPGTFTTFKAFEYSPTLEAGGMIHRNVIFRGSNVTEEAGSAYDLYTDTRLWEWLESNCQGDCQVLAIPHNSNYSWGKTFGMTTTYGEEYTNEDIDRRINLEPLVEIAQSKGASECAFGVGSSDEECAFEQFFEPCPENSPEGTPECVQEGSFVRNALKKGLLLEGEIGKNPFKLGIIGSRDTHNGDPGGTEENIYAGHHAGREDTPEERVLGESLFDQGGAIINSPGALAGVWAEENTRNSIFDALRRKETFGTSGTRLKVRLFGGWDYPNDLHNQSDRVEVAYAEGVPMGGDLTNAPVDEAPDFMVLAMRDVNSAPLQRVQIIKGWEAEGVTKEAVYDVVCSDGLTPDPSTHLCPFNAVEKPTSEQDCLDLLNTETGDSQLSYTWSDPNFDSSQRAFYYARVLESPTCRWSTYDALYLGKDPENPSGNFPVDSTIKERAWSSPIWYTPGTIPNWTLKDAIAANGPFTVQLFEEAGIEPLNDDQLKELTVGQTLVQKNLFTGQQYSSRYTTKGKRIVYINTDRLDVSDYEIRDNLRYEKISGKQIGWSIYGIYNVEPSLERLVSALQDAPVDGPVNTLVQHLVNRLVDARYIACNPLDGGYCKWEISQK
ncbi:hypothetical protein BJP34_17345 [Moorena producens PAL-8-15-08-1]|uniref:DUF3604 domain-containing protein n=1 Tax=Moorena producens PAL-8-15-08-1 TaxID=1458985 RepID=A0A1D8TTU4_9CYAN|nr:DUF3604 domain-containing protein [Moorena producens]AOX00973.1 hypothetical protein BJP34_17345 [Moorena producens PAL-8-15-08-1]